MQLITGWKSICIIMGDVGVRTLKKWIKFKKLPVKKIGGCILADKEELLKWIKAQPTRD